MRLFDVVDHLQDGYYLTIKDEKENIYGGRVCTVRYVSDKLKKKGYYEIILLTGDRYYSYTTENNYEVIALKDTEDNDLFTDLYEKHYCLDGDIVDKIKEIITSWDDYDGTGKTDMIILLRHYLGISKNVIKLITFLHNLYPGRDQFEEKTQDETEFMIETIKNVTQESDESAIVATSIDTTQSSGDETGNALKGMNDSLDNLQQYVNKRHQIIKDFANGDKDLSKYGEKTYDELMSENDSNIQNALKNANSYKQQILSIVKTQSQKEQDALFKVIDARKEALKKKRDYYEYDKKMKSSTKEINLLQQQIDALDDVGDAETRAQKARLEAQLKDAQDDLDDTVRDHVYDLQVDGLDDLEDQLKEDFEKWSNELSGNLDKMSQAINDAINNSGASAADAMNTLAEVLKQFNITPDQLGISASNLSAGNIKKYDKGTKHIGHNSVVMTNENGREIIVTDKGWLTDVHTGDEIISTADTAALGEVAEKYRNNELLPNIRIPEIKSDGDRNVVYNYTNNSPVTIQGDLVRDTLPDLKTILKESSKYTQNEMRKNLRRT